MEITNNLFDTFIEVDINEISLDKTLVLGQTFNWNYESISKTYYKALFGRLVALKQDGSKIYLNKAEVIEDMKNYLDLYRIYSDIEQFKDIKNKYLNRIVERGKGIHILNQDLTEVIITFIISACNNMKRIDKSVRYICETYGNEVEWMGLKAYTFPSAKNIEEKGIEKLKQAGIGYRYDYVAYAVEILSKHGEEKFKQLDDSKLFTILNRLKGVGPKVASCIMLFGAGRTDVFPVDRHIQNAIYRNGITLTEIDKYSPYRGILQQYMFYDMTN